MNKILFENIVDSLVENGYVVLENSLENPHLQGLLKLAKNESKYKVAGISKSENLQIDRSKRRDKTVWLDEDGGVVSEYLAFSDSLRSFLNESLYLGLNYYEAHFALYEKGDFYEKHLDAFKGSSNRKITTVLYLNEEWSESDGGELLIYDEDGRVIEKVIPKLGTLVVFLSDTFPHEVLPSNKKRYSIAGWFRVDKR
jgi:SM-20-related protein